MESHCRLSQLPVLILICTSLLISCQQSPASIPLENATEITSLAAPSENITLQSGFQIPDGTMPQREATYDDPIGSPGGVLYRSNADDSDWTDFKTKIDVSKVALGDNFTVVYRRYIETKAGQIRINIVGVGHGADTEILERNRVNLKLADLPDGIQVKNIGEGVVARYSVVLMMEVPPQVKPGDYKMGFLVFIADKYYGELPCTIHVTN